MHVLIAGGGVAGLASALAFARQGARVTVFEQAAGFSGIGGGLQISPNGARVLEAFGLTEALDAAALQSEGVELFDGFGGRRLMFMPMGQEPVPYRLIRRPALLALLAEAASAAGAEIRTGSAVAGFGPGAALALEGGGRVEGDLVIGADGIRSRLRAALSPGQPPAFTGYTAWRALVPGEAPSRTRAWLLPDRHVVAYPVAPGLLNLVAARRASGWEGEARSRPAAPEDLHRTYGDTAPELRAILHGVDEVRLWGLFRSPVAAQWWAPGQVLVGDAAHSTLPFAAQGANMALEDAWLLARLCSLHGNGAEALAAFQARRAPRAARAVAQADRNGRLYHLGGLPRRVSQAVMRASGAIFARRLRRRLRWLYDYDVTR